MEKQPRACGSCGSTNVYTRLGGAVVCRRCGTVTPKKKAAMKRFVGGVEAALDAAEQRARTNEPKKGGTP